MTEEINALKDNLKNNAARACIARISAPDYHTDQASGISTREQLALSWLAIHDNDSRIGSLEDARDQFIEGLYEIQRGYNLSEGGVDNGSDSDHPICAGGTFNKLLEKLVGVHPEVTIDVVTQNLATLKLPFVVKDEVKHYLTIKAKPATFDEFVEFNHQIKKIEEEGVEVIWEAIKEKVAMRMFEEFESLYDGLNDPRFTNLIEAGKYTELGKLPSFQKEISESEGYRQYLSSMLYSSRFFSKNQKSDSSLSDDDTHTPLPKS